MLSATKKARSATLIDHVMPPVPRPRAPQKAYFVRPIQSSGGAGFRAPLARLDVAIKPVPRLSGFTAQQIKQLLVQSIIGGEDMAAIHHAVAPIEIGDDAAGFAH